MPREFLKLRANTELALPDYRVVLFNSLTGVDTTMTAAEVLDQECLQTVDGYESYPYTYTADTSTYNGTLGREVAPDVTASFTEDSGGTGYDFTHVGLWQGRGPQSNKAISAVDTALDRVTCTAHGVSNGDLGFVRSPGTGIGLSIQAYYMKAVDANTLEFYTDAGLTAIADITSTGTGTHYLVYAEGRLVQVAPFGLVTVGPGQTVSFVVSYRFG